MRITPKYSNKDTIVEWTLKKLQSNPELYGGDNGNNEIILAYIKETNPLELVHAITVETIAHSVAVSRAKNKLFIHFPEPDYRVKYKPKKKQ